MPKALLIYGSVEGQTHKIEDVMAGHFRQHGWEADVLDVRKLPPGLALEDYDGVVVGAPIHAGRHPEPIHRFVTAHREALAERRAAFFSVSLSAAGDESEQADAQRCLDDFLQDTGWHPPIARTIAGALRYREYNLFKRYLMRKLMEQGGHETDTSRNHEYTDWQQVHDFVEAVVALAQR
ncbi:MAG: protoporphyrinogen oxidase [Candidatus Hydrogenedens sp.]|nr:protoporphyrinogen oxidase [Candidatus Hydrogenedens sp.]